MGKLEIQIHDLEKAETETVNTDGCLLVYLESANKVKVVGKFDMRTLGPILAKFLMEKIVG